MGQNAREMAVNAHSRCQMTALRGEVALRSAKMAGKRQTLTAARWDEIRALREAGDTPRTVAERFPDVSVGQVKAIWNGTRKRPGWIWERAEQREAERLPMNGRAIRCELSTVDQVTLFLSQDSLCYLCGDSLDFDLAHVDHDHTHEACEGKGCRHCVRGLVHTQCNTAIGLLGDDPDRLRRVADGLQQAIVQTRAGWS